MKIDYETIKSGDLVQIADGAWFTVERWCVNPDDLAIRTYCGQVCLAYAQRLITAHEPAHEPQPVGEYQQGDKVRIQSGAWIWQDMSSAKWADEGEVFYVESVRDNRVFLWNEQNGGGIHGRAGKYGNGGISCKLSDLIPVNSRPQPVGECEWVTEEELANCVHVLINHDKSGYELRGVFELNALLTEKHGHPPIVRTFNGEPASKWGLEEDSWVLAYCHGRYSDRMFKHLNTGDKWRYQPAWPDGGES